MFLRGFCVVLFGFTRVFGIYCGLNFRKVYGDKSGRFYVFCPGKRASLGGFVRGLFGFWEHTREGFSVVLENEILS